MYNTGMATTIIGRQEATYLQRVYAWLTFGILCCSASATATIMWGAPISATYKDRIVEMPPAVALVAAHPIIFSLTFIFFAVMASLFRKSGSASLPIFIGFTSFSGLFIGPALFTAQVAAAAGGTLSGSPVRDAGALTLVSFVGLTCYAAWSKRDFSVWGAALSTGLWVLIGAMFLNVFMGSTAMGLAISSVAVFVFAGYIIYDTHNVLKMSHGDDALGDALNLFLDILNLFLHLLRILSSGYKKD